MELLNRLLAFFTPIVPKPLVGYVSKRYVAGVRVGDAVRVVRHLASQGAMATLDILGEFIKTMDEADANTEAYRNLVRRVRDENLPETNVSIKLTGVGLLLDRERCLNNMRRIMETVRECDNFLRIDMEDSPCTTATLEIYRALRSEFPGRVGVALQSRLRRTMDDFDGLADEPTNIRLCKGIYLEPRDIAYTDPELIRKNYTALLDRMLEAGAYVGIATHDERLIWDAVDLIRRHGLTGDQYEFQMLLGVDEPLRRLMLRDGHRLRVYVPFGKDWYAYSMRRVRENPQIAGHVFRQFFGAD